MSPFKNVVRIGLENSSMHMFLRSLDAQNYSNYQVYMIDDASDDGSAEEIMKELWKYPRLNNRITMLRNT